MSRADELIALIEGNKPKSRAQELIDSVEGQQKRHGYTGTWEERPIQKFFKQPSIAREVLNVVAAAPMSIAEGIATGNPKPVSEMSRTALETFGGTFGGMPGYVAGKRAADAVDVYGLGMPKEGLPKTLLADYYLNKYADIGDKYYPDNVVSKLLRTPPKRGTVSGEINQTVRDFMDASTLQGIGEAAKTGIEKVYPLVKKGYGFLASHIPWKSNAKIKEMAGRELEPIVRNIETIPEYGKMYEETRKLEKEIPGVKYTLGQASGEPNAIMTERRFARGEPGGSPEKFELQKLRSQLSGEEYAKAAIPSVGEDVDEVISAAKNKQRLLENRVKQASGKAENIYIKNKPTGDLTKIQYNKGQDIFERAKKIKGSLYGQAEEKYNKVPNLLLKTDDMVDDLLGLKKEFETSGYDASRFPYKAYNNIFKRIATTNEKGEIIAKDIPFQELRGIRSSVKNDLRAIGSAENYDAVQKYYANTIQDTIEAGLSQVKDINEDAAKAFGEATKFYKETYIPSVRQRTVGSILTPGRTGAETKYDYSAIPGKFTKNVDTAKDYTRIFGHGDKDIQETMMTEMLNVSEKDGLFHLGKARAWYGKNQGVLGELGISKPFKEVIKSQQSLESASENLDNFNKSVLSKILPGKVDPQFAIEKAFEGNTKNTAATMRSLLQSLPSEKTPVGISARKGLQRAFVDFLFKKSERELQSEISKEVGRSPIVNIAKRSSLLNQYDGALKELYKNDLKKYHALHKYQQNYEVLQRNLRSPFGGGSDTKELLAKDVGRMSGIALQGFGAKIKIFRILSRYYAAGLEAKVNAIIEKGLLDPDVAFDLVRGLKQPDILPKVIDKHLANMSTYGIGGRLVPIKEDIRQSKE